MMKKSILDGKQFTGHSLNSDLMFKIVFAGIGRENLLICLINALLQYEDNDIIEEIIILNPFVIQGFVAYKIPIIEIIAKDRLKRNIRIKIQRRKRGSMEEMLYSASANYTNQLKSGKPYSDFKKTINLWIIDEKLTDEPEVYNKYLFKHEKNNETFTELIEYHFVELDKYSEKPKMKRTRFEKWLNVLKFSENYKSIEDLPKDIIDEDGIKEAIETMLHANTDDRLREIMISYDMAR